MDGNADYHSWKNENDIIYAVSKRAGELANRKMDELRLMACSDAEGRLGSARQEFLGCSRGELIDIILTEEFIWNEISPRLLEETEGA